MTSSLPPASSPPIARAPRRLDRYSSAAVLLLALVINVWGLAAVPFHPDETTWLFMSRDLPLILRQGPSAVCWLPGAQGDPVQQERARTAPLPRYILGLERLTGILPAGAVPVDWDWTASWEANAARGAIPSASMLLAARLPMALLSSLSALLVFLVAKRMGGSIAGWAAALLFISNALILLHGRRAMGEAALVFGVCLAVWLMMKLRRSAVLQGAGVALAVLAKHSGVVIAPVALLSSLWPGLAFTEMDPLSRQRAKADGVVRAMRSLTLMALAALIVFGLLSPTLWCHPFAAIDAVLRERTSLVDAQKSELRAAGAIFILDTPAERIVALIDRVFVAGPVFWEIPNYSSDTASSEAAYLGQPHVDLWRGPIWGSVMLALTLAGAAIGALLVFRRATGSTLRRDLALGLVWLLSTTLALLALVPIAWQRYYLPLVPALCMWQGFALSHGARAAALLRGRVRPS